MVAAVAMVKDEADIIATTVGWMTRQVDLVIVADNRSTDGTRDILEALGSVQVIDDPEVGYYQSQKMTNLARRAMEQGADWVVPFDADEMHLACNGMRLADVLADVPDNVLVVEAPLFDHVATGTDDQHLADPVERLTWRRAAQAPLRKVACRARPDLVIHQGNHSCHYDQERYVPHVSGVTEVRHFPYRSPEQMVRKAVNGGRAYQASNLPEHIGQHWRDYSRLVDQFGEKALHDVFHQWFYVKDPEQEQGLVQDPCPK